MATSKTLTPTNVTIQIPAFTDAPDQRVNSNCIDKEADAINALNSNVAKCPKNEYTPEQYPLRHIDTMWINSTGTALIIQDASGNAKSINFDSS